MEGVGRVEEMILLGYGSIFLFLRDGRSSRGTLPSPTITIYDLQYFLGV
jgi:hypothetical protein